MEENTGNVKDEKEKKIEAYKVILSFLCKRLEDKKYNGKTIWIQLLYISIMAIFGYPLLIAIAYSLLGFKEAPFSFWHIMSMIYTILGFSIPLLKNYISIKRDEKLRYYLNNCNGVPDYERIENMEKAINYIIHSLLPKYGKVRNSILKECQRIMDKSTGTNTELKNYYPFKRHNH
ncbi:MAG TPA: hypothetical protein VIK14_06415 [Ignavibacteria bacterium]